MRSGAAEISRTSGMSTGGWTESTPFDDARLCLLVIWERLPTGRKNL